MSDLRHVTEHVCADCGARQLIEGYVSYSSKYVFVTTAGSARKTLCPDCYGKFAERGPEGSSIEAVINWLRRSP